MDRKYYMPILRSYYKAQLDKVLKVASKRDNIHESNNGIMNKIHTQNVIGVIIVFI